MQVLRSINQTSLLGYTQGVNLARPIIRTIYLSSSSVTPTRTQPLTRFIPRLSLTYCSIHSTSKPSSVNNRTMSTPTTSPSKRGVFILLEGLDRSGKSSQCVRLAQTLNTEQPNSAVQMRFPDRETAIGKMIDAYLKQSTEIDDHAIHLLFSANRWEKHGSMLAALQAGQHLVVDRYAYSGIAFTSSKVGIPNLGLNWTTAPDRGLLAPDLVIFLDITSEDAAKRGSFGEERYEKKEIQDRVREVFKKLRLQASGQETTGDDAAFGVGVEWSVVNAGQTQDQVHAEILALTKKAIEKSSTLPIKYL